MRWISVKEQMPEKCVKVKIDTFDPVEKRCYAWIAWHDAGKWWIDTKHILRSDIVVFQWRPLFKREQENAS